MNKYELIGLTMDRLLEHFKLSPESFEFTDSGYSPRALTIVWQPKVQLNDYMNTVIQDPNNSSHGVIVTWNCDINELSCHLFLRATSHIKSCTADCSMTSKRWFEKRRKNYKKFERLQSLILQRDRYKENMNYLKKLTSVFPDALDNHFLKD